MLAGVRSVYAFALIGPLETSWQIADAGFGLAGDDGGPKNISDEYRWNTRYIYYAFDASFLSYFGTNMANEVDKGFAVFNSLSNLTSYSSNLSEWPLNTSRYNHTAFALNLLDVKSMTMSRVANMLGLAQPERYAFNIHDRYLSPNTTCPSGENYVVVMRNFDPITFVPSSYVDGTLFDYFIEEFCTSPVPPVYVSIPFQVDPTAPTQIAVADGVDASYGSYDPVPGRFFTGLTRDDVGGLRYLMGTNTMNVESVDTNSLLVFTNQSNPQLLVTSNLEIFLEQAATNDAVTLETLYPGLIITATTNYFSNIVTTNITAFLTNPPNAPAGTFVTAFATNFTTNVGTLFAHTFANVITNHYYTNGFLTVTVTNFSTPFGAPAGYFTTNVASTNYFTNFVNGDFYLIPSNALCSSSGYQILSTQLVNLIAITNTFGTNNSGTANGITNGQSTAFSIITYFTNYSLIVYPIQCVTNSVELREGMDKIVFIRKDFDSLLGTDWTPVTNTYNLTAVTNGMPVVQTFQRIITRPDIIIQAKDQIIGPATQFWIATFNNLNFDSANVSSDGLGPGTIVPPVQFVFGKGGGPIFWNTGGFFQSQATATPFFEWGSFDGSTNAPVVYPSSVSLAGLSTQVFFQILSGVLPLGSVSTNGVASPYSVQLTAQGASPPFTWSLDTNSPALPGGLTLSGGGTISGPLSGATPGIYDFQVDAKDSVGRITEKSLFIQINP